MTTVSEIINLYRNSGKEVHFQPSEDDLSPYFNENLQTQRGDSSAEGFFYGASENLVVRNVLPRKGRLWVTMKHR